MYKIFGVLCEKNRKKLKMKMFPLSARFRLCRIVISVVEYIYLATRVKFLRWLVAKLYGPDQPGPLMGGVGMPVKVGILKLARGNHRCVFAPT
jgi:hypothetical protein